MNRSDLSQFSLFEPIQPRFRGFVCDAVTSKFWAFSPSNPKSKEFDDTSGYIEFFEREWRNARKREHAARSYQDIIDIINYTHMLKNRENSREALRNDICFIHPRFRPEFGMSLEAHKHATEIIDNSMDLALRIFLMVKLQRVDSCRLSNPYAIGGETITSWEEKQTLKEILDEEFQESQLRAHKDRELSALLTARNLELYGGFRITWTSNLAEHLCITRYDNFTEVAIFHYATVLRWHTSSNALPHGLAEETLRTLALLLPSRDFVTRHYSQLGIDKRAFSHGDIQLRDIRKVATYTYWRDRLLNLERAFDESEPASLWQWWYDRRKRREWATFWVAVLVLILTVFFGLIQSITGIVGAWAAVRQLEQGGNS